MYRFISVDFIASPSFSRIPLGASSGSGAFGVTPSTPHLEYLGESRHLDHRVTLDPSSMYIHAYHHEVLINVSINIDRHEQI